MAARSNHVLKSRDWSPTLIACLGIRVGLCCFSSPKELLFLQAIAWDMTLARFTNTNMPPSPLYSPRFPIDHPRAHISGGSKSRDRTTLTPLTRLEDVRDKLIGCVGVVRRACEQPLDCHAIYRQRVEAALNETTARAYALAGADVTQDLLGNRPASVKCDATCLVH